MTSSSPLVPTFYGHIASTHDALLLFEACLSGALNHVARRPHDRERPSLIKSGNVFIYEEHSSGIKRWTDGVPWSPSRILGNFLVYRELERPFPPGEKKRAMKRSKRSPGISKQEVGGGPGNGMGSGYNTAAASPNFESSNSNSLSKETERSLIGSLIDSYGFKEQGLVKKTVSVTIGGVSHHLVSYYSVQDVMNNKFIAPSKDPRFQHVTPRPDLITKQNFRTPIDEVDSMDRMDDRSVYGSYSYPRTGFETTNQNISHRTMSLPTPPYSYPAATSSYPSYGSRVPSSQYDARGPSQSGTSFNSQFAPPSNIYPPHRTENYGSDDYRQQRYNSVTVDPESDRSQPHPVVTNFTRRPSNFEQGNSIDSGMSEMSSSSTDSKYTNDSGYSSQCYSDTANTPQMYNPQHPLPIPTQNPYDRPSVQPYGGIDDSTLKREGLWSIGSAGAGHGHYIASQQQGW